MRARGGNRRGAAPLKSTALHTQSRPETRLCAPTLPGGVLKTGACYDDCGIIVPRSMYYYFLFTFIGSCEESHNMTTAQVRYDVAEPIRALSRPNRKPRVPPVPAWRLGAFVRVGGGSNGLPPAPTSLSHCSRACKYAYTHSPPPIGSRSTATLAASCRHFVLLKCRRLFGQNTAPFLLPLALLLIDIRIVKPEDRNLLSFIQLHNGRSYR